MLCCVVQEMKRGVGLQLGSGGGMLASAEGWCKGASEVLCWVGVMPVV